MKFKNISIVISFLAFALSATSHPIPYGINSPSTSFNDNRVSGKELFHNLYDKDDDGEFGDDEDSLRKRNFDEALLKKRLEKRATTRGKIYDIKNRGKDISNIDKINNENPSKYQFKNSLKNISNIPLKNPYDIKELNKLIENTMINESDGGKGEEIKQEENNIDNSNENPIKTPAKSSTETPVENLLNTPLKNPFDINELNKLINNENEKGEENNSVNLVETPDENPAENPVENPLEKPLKNLYDISELYKLIGDGIINEPEESKEEEQKDIEVNKDEQYTETPLENDETTTSDNTDNTNDETTTSDNTDNTNDNGITNETTEPEGEQQETEEVPVENPEDKLGDSEESDKFKDFEELEKKTNNIKLYNVSVKSNNNVVLEKIN